MLKKIFITLFLLTLSIPAYAQNQAALCKLWFTHKDQPQTSSAEYQPGIDVHGNPVTPADLNEPVKAFSNAIRIPITIDLAQQLTQTVPQGTELQAAVGMIEVHSNGRVLYNEQDITDETMKLCLGEDAAKMVMKEKEAATPPEPQPVIVTDPPPEDDQVIWGEGY